MKVLLCADNARVAAQVSTALLGRPDTDIFEVRAPQRALALLDDGQPYDVVVADADTAPTGGFALTREIKARGVMGHPMPPVVLLIARPADRFLANWSQADAHLLKPVDPFDFAEVLDAVVAGGPVPALPGVGAAPVDRLGEIPGPEYEREESEGGEGPEAARASGRS